MNMRVTLAALLLVLCAFTALAQGPGRTVVYEWTNDLRNAAITPEMTFEVFQDPGACVAGVEPANRIATNLPSTKIIGTTLPTESYTTTNVMPGRYCAGVRGVWNGVPSKMATLTVAVPPFSPGTFKSTLPPLP